METIIYVATLTREWFCINPSPPADSDIPDSQHSHRKSKSSRSSRQRSRMSSTRDNALDYYPPAEGGGSMLDVSAGLGEPLNVIISGKSSPEVLTDEGIMQWAHSIGFAREFLGMHQGTPQTANLGDGNGSLPEIKVIRENFNLPIIGSGIETLMGGNHFRYWRQNGPKANTGALFLAVSHEMNVSEHHMIVANGYDKGRDELVAKAVGTTSQLTVTYSTTAQKLKGLLSPGAQGINHNIAIDGDVYLLTIKIVK